MARPAVTIVKVAGEGIIDSSGSNVSVIQNDDRPMASDFVHSTPLVSDAGHGRVPHHRRYRSGPRPTRTTITVNVVDPDAVEEVVVVEPDPEPLTWSRDLQNGWNVVAWSGEDSKPADVVAGTNITAIYHWDGATFTWYFPGDTAGIPNNARRAEQR